MIKDARRVDDYTVDLILEGPNPLLLNGLTSICMMDKEWMTEHKCLDPIDPSKGQESLCQFPCKRHGPFMLESRQPDAKTILAANPNWWDKPQHNLTRIVFTPIKSDATRVAALLSGEVDFIHPSPLQDADRLSRTPGIKLMEGAELRTVMLAVNQAPEQPNDSNVTARIPAKGRPGS